MQHAGGVAARRMMDDAEAVHQVRGGEHADRSGGARTRRAANNGDTNKPILPRDYPGNVMLLWFRFVDDVELLLIKLIDLHCSG